MLNDKQKSLVRQTKSFKICKSSLPKELRLWMILVLLEMMVTHWTLNPLFHYRRQRKEDESISYSMNSHQQLVKWPKLIKMTQTNNQVFSRITNTSHSCFLKKIKSLCKKNSKTHYKESELFKINHLLEAWSSSLQTILKSNYVLILRKDSKLGKLWNDRSEPRKGVFHLYIHLLSQH